MAIGMFDGLHPGHQQLLAHLHKVAQERHLTPCLWTFGQSIPKPGFERLMSEPQYLRALAANGIREVHRMDFIKEVSELSAEEFLKQVLIEKLCVKVLVLGADAHLGKNRGSSALEFQHLARNFGVVVEILQMQKGPWGDWSSSQMRDWIRLGQFDKVEQMLARPYTIGGIVVKDQGLAHKLGYPTANLEMKGMLCPPLGVYRVNVTLPDRPLAPQYLAMAYVGTRPTLALETRVVFEAHLLNFSDELYGEYMEVGNFYYCRPEIKFNNLDELKQQLARDCAKVQGKECLD